MKKKLLILIGILVVIYIVMTLIDTGEYRVEQKMWRMQKQYMAIAQDPEVVPDKQFEKVIQQYRQMIKKHPESRYVPQMYSSIGMLYSLKKDYDSARKVFGEVVTRFADDKTVVAKAMMDIGNVYLLQEDTKKAVDVYQRIWSEYERTEVGFMMPMFIASVYRNAGNNAKTDEWLQKAVSFYDTVAHDTMSSDAVRITAYQTKAAAYVGLEKWQSVIDTGRTMLNEFADSRAMTLQRLRGITRTINMIAISRLQDYDAAKKVYQDFIQTNPNHRLNGILAKVLESLDILKDRGVGAAMPAK